MPTLPSTLSNTSFCKRRGGIRCSLFTTPPAKYLLYIHIDSSTGQELVNVYFADYTDTMAGKSLLLVDDSPLITERLQTMLRGLKSIRSIDCARDYPEASQLLMNTPFDIVLLDINLPGKSGIDLLQHIKANYPKIIVIMLTNRSEAYYRAICKKWGADYFMDKSSEFEEVPLILSSLL